MAARAPRCVGISAFCVLALGCVDAAAQATRPDLSPQQQRQLLVQAKQAYYNLHTAGASGVVTCQVVMEWDNHWATQDASLPKIAHAEQLTTALKTVTFKVILHTDNSIEATPLNLPTLADPKEAEWQDEVIARMRGALRVVMQGWARYEIRAAFERPEIQSTVLDLGSHYTVNYEAWDAKEDITIGRDFLIENIHLKTPDGVTGSTRPRFTLATGGYLITGWDTTISGRVGLSVSASVTYADVQGIHLPRTIVASYKPSHPGAKIILTLSNYQFRKV